MRTSSGKARGAIKAIVILAIIALLVGAAAFFMVPYGSKSELMWHDYRQERDLDTIIVGSSQTERGLDPAVIDRIRNTNSFNMSSPDQEPAESFIGMREAIENHPVEYVVYGVDFAKFQGEYTMYPGRVYLNEKWEDDPFLERFTDLDYALVGTDWLFDNKSINWLFPWVEQHVTSGASSIPANAMMRLNGVPLAQAAEANDPGWQYVDRGYGNYDWTLDYNTDAQYDYGSVYRLNALNDQRMQNLADMCEYCAERNITFVAVVPPLPDFSFISMGAGYQQRTQELAEFVEAHGGTYYDFNLATPDVFENEEGYYMDYQHLNMAGGEAFSVAVAGLLDRIAAGEDVNGTYMTYDERVASIDHISTVKFTDRIENGALVLQAQCYAGSQLQVEYQFLAMKPGSDTFEIVREYASDPVFVYEPDQRGDYTIRVNARQVGSDVEFEKYTQHEVAF